MRRVFVKKKEGFEIESDSLLQELRQLLNISAITKIELYQIYDIFDAREEEVELLSKEILADLFTDELMQAVDTDGKTAIAYEFLPGQFDQRADSVKQCAMLLNLSSDIRVRSGKLVLLEGNLTKEELEEIKEYLINPIEMQEKDLNHFDEPEAGTAKEVPIVEGFIRFNEEELRNYHESHGFAFSMEDLTFVQNYFATEEKRDPYETELKVLDTYWSDHCRHTTFETSLIDIQTEKGVFQDAIQAVFQKYLDMRRLLNREDRAITLMDMATIFAKYKRAQGGLQNLDISDEINACSFEIEVEVDGERQPWLLMFKNETHNHPTEIEPFGGASTCIGGAIRDPLSGRSYVYQAMRITGAGDIWKPLDQTMENKLPQSVISKKSADGYSSYGNQIGLATTYVKELYDIGYEAKRMEVGVVVGATPKSNVIREQPAPGDIILLVGGETGRDGIGGATGSSKEHDETSLTEASSEVQKGNAPVERKIQRLFRNPEVARRIKRCNDFGAGGVSVAIGEIARGICIDLDRVTLKYDGLNGTEIAISESQERMAVMIDPKHTEFFIAEAKRENLAAVPVAEVTKDERLVMRYRETDIVNISRKFLDTNGITQKQTVRIQSEPQGSNPFARRGKLTKQSLLGNLKTAHSSMQKGLVEMFDSTIGKSTVLMPYGGKYQMTEQEGSAQKLPVFGFTNTTSLLTYGFDPVLANYSPYLSASYSLVDALTRLTAMGGDYKKAYLSNQEYFEKMQTDPTKWGKVTQALLGLLEAQDAMGVAAIGGKDSMSGSFKDLNVPPTLISFTVAPEKSNHVLSSEFKEPNHHLYLLKHERLDHEMPNYPQLKDHFDTLLLSARSGSIVSAMSIKQGGIAEALCKMSYGNRVGVSVMTQENVFEMQIGSILVESRTELSMPGFLYLGKTTKEEEISINGVRVSITEALDASNERNRELYPLYAKDSDASEKEDRNSSFWKKVGETSQIDGVTASRYIRRIDRCKPKVLIPVFPGTNCEYDTAEQFVRNGADVDIFVLQNLDRLSLKESLSDLKKRIQSANILSLVGGFSAGDEPDGSGKFIAQVLKNHIVAEGIQDLLRRDGLILGICNGFQALVKSGLLPHGHFQRTDENSATLFKNDINRHISKMGTTRVTSVLSPWMSSFEIGEQHTIAFSHGEGKFVIDEKSARELFKNGQVATQYSDEKGTATIDVRFNPNGSNYGIEGISSADGRIFGKMGHSERYEDGLFQNIPGNKVQNIFANGIRYFAD